MVRVKSLLFFILYKILLNANDLLNVCFANSISCLYSFKASSPVITFSFMNFILYYFNIFPSILHLLENERKPFFLHIYCMEEYMDTTKKIIMIIIVSIVLIRTNQKIFKWILKKQNKIHINFLSGIITACIIFLAISMIGMQFENTKEIFKSILKSSGLFVAVAGFAAQQTLNNIISGLMLSVAKPFDIGERVNLVNSNITGIIETITLRHTVIKGFDNQRIVIPNSVINNEILKNSNYDDSVIGNYLEVTISYESDIRKAVSVFDSIIRNHRLVITNEYHNPGVIVKDLTETGIILKATVWTKNVSDNFQASSDIRMEIIEQFKHAKIEIPYKKIELISRKHEIKKRRW
ncbi:mechanosensitive ion channel family protein [Enterocloster aldenensis]|nr:mechanosensitive ion channel family protein [Enterocloster aldenensis]